LKAAGERLAIVSALPCELYPPTVNLVRTVQQHPNINLLLICATGSAVACSIPRARAATARFSAGHGCRFVLLRWILLICWHLKAAWLLWRFRPDSIVLIEPHSVPAVRLALLLLKSRPRVAVIYYEYNSPADYLRSGNRSLRCARPLENQLLKLAGWISQTNAERLRLFCCDHRELRQEQCMVLPNFPPAAWLEIPAVRRGRQVPAAKQLKLVYVGALSLQDTWIDAVVHWICSDQNVACSLDVYAPRLDPETAQFLLSRQGDRLRLHHEGIEYDRLPHVLPQYDVGLILYRCRTINFVHNAPNKLFEYLMCGLDVWYPPCMLGVRPFARSDVVPRVIEVDFDQLNALPAGMGQSSCAELPSRPWKSTCEDALQPLVQFITGADNRGNGLNTGCTIAAAMNA
jgi:hypothetical protein